MCSSSTGKLYNKRPFSPHISGRFATNLRYVECEKRVFFDYATLAYYNQADKYPKLIVNNVNTSIGSVIFPVMSQSQDDPEKIKQMTRKAIQISSFLIWPIMVGLAAVSRPLASVC